MLTWLHFCQKTPKTANQCQNGRIRIRPCFQREIFEFHGLVKDCKNTQKGAKQVMSYTLKLLIILTKYSLHFSLGNILVENWLHFFQKDFLLTEILPLLFHSHPTLHNLLSALLKNVKAWPALYTVLLLFSRKTPWNDELQYKLSLQLVQT